MFELYVRYNTIILNMNYGVNKLDDLKTGTPSVHKISPACSGQRWKYRTFSEQIHVLSAQFRPCADNLSEQIILQFWVVINHSATSVCNSLTSVYTCVNPMNNLTAA